MCSSRVLARVELVYVTVRVSKTVADCRGCEREQVLAGQVVRGTKLGQDEELGTSEEACSESTSSCEN